VTNQQRKALHKFCELLAEALNDAGFDFKAFMEQVNYQSDVSWTKYLVKDQLWRVIQRPMTMSDEFPEGKESTEDLTNGEVSRIYEQLSKQIGEATGVYVAWPNHEELKDE